MLLHVQHKSKAKVGMNASFVKLIKQDKANPGKGGILLEESGENPLGDHLNSGSFTDLRFTSHPVSHQPAHFLIHLGCHVFSCSARGKAAWFEHDDFLAVEPRLAQQHKGDTCGLPSPRRGREDAVAGLAECGCQFRNDFVNGQRRGQRASR